MKASLVAQMVTNLLAMQETQVQSLGQKDPLEKDMTKELDTTEWWTWHMKVGKFSISRLQKWIIQPIMLGQVTVIQTTGKLDICDRKDFMIITLMTGKFDLRTSKTFIRPKKFTKVKNTSLSPIRPEVKGKPQEDVLSGVWLFAT